MEKFEVRMTTEELQLLIDCVELANKKFNKKSIADLYKDLQKIKGIADETFAEERAKKMQKQNKVIEYDFANKRTITQG